MAMTTSGKRRPVLSVIVPVFDETDNLSSFLDRLVGVVQALDVTHEIIVVDDGSEDGGTEAVRHLRQQGHPVVLVELSRNFGKELAMLAGYDHARGEATLVIDADHQQPPELIPEMLDAWRRGAEIVDAVRIGTAGSWWPRRACSWLFYSAMSRLSSVPLIENASDFRLLDQAALHHLRACRERGRFNRGLVSWIGFRRVSVSYEARQRDGSESRFSILKLLGYAFDALLSLSATPLRLVGLYGLVLSLVSFAYLAWLVWDAVARSFPIDGFATLAGGVFLLGGSILLAIWMLGEYVARIFEETKNRPEYIVRRVVGPEEKQIERSATDSPSPEPFDGT
jgi:glycosyltransferase involved in cell wall biosynthesis